MPSINGFDLIIDEKNLRFISIFVIYLHLEQLSPGWPGLLWIKLWSEARAGPEFKYELYQSNCDTLPLCPEWLGNIQANVLFHRYPVTICLERVHTGERGNNYRGDLWYNSIIWESSIVQNHWHVRSGLIFIHLLHKASSSGGEGDKLRKDVGKMVLTCELKL